MTVLAGIDEAGLGPLLGPLALGWSAFSVPDARCMWERLAPVVSRAPREDARCVIVADSKVVFTRNPRGERRLERTALAFLGQLADPPLDARSLVLRTPPSMRPEESVFERHPWYTELPSRLPCFQSEDDIVRSVGRLRAMCGEAQVCFRSGGVALFPAGALNDSYRRTDNKSRTLWEKTAPILRHLWAEFGVEGIALTIDRQGGRLHYRDLLAETLPEAQIESLREGRAGSEYSLSTGGRSEPARTMRVLFVEKADRSSFPVALASCLAKYGRELSMGAFNRYFEVLQPELKPTAGYTTDGRRWIEDVAPTLARAAIDADVLIRER